MEWIKIPTDNILYSEYKDSELIALIKYQALYSQLETEPTLPQLKRVLNQKQLKFVMSCKGVVEELVKSQVKVVKTKRNRDKESYLKKQGLTKKSASGKSSESKLVSGTDKIRLDKIRNKEIYKEKIAFDIFYNLYPVKKSKQEALKKWNKLKIEEQQQCIDVLKSDKHKHWLSKQDIKFIKHPSTWLNQGCWEDELEEVKKEPLW